MIPQRSPATPGVIWITGYSGSGKTTVGRVVERELQQKRVPAIFLDGDDLRNIFAEKWGYTRADRIELARVYFRLCSYLSSQGFTVVLAAVAMYDEVRDWIRANIPNVIEVFLDVPEEERIRRDKLTKNVYSRLGSLKDLYDEPTAPGLRVASYGDVSPAAAASQIVQHFLASRGAEGVNKSKSEHWESFYRRGVSEKAPSPFAQYVAGRLRGDERLLEIGCGNGRDASFFSSRGLTVVAIDASDAAIDLCQEARGENGAHFVAGRLSDLKDEIGDPFDVIYSRFVLHAMTQDEEAETLTGAYRTLRPGGSLYLECRSINDPLARLGEVISPTERIHGHYRRFIILAEIVQRLQTIGFHVDQAVEDTGFAAYQDEDPMVIRIRSSK